MASISRLVTWLTLLPHIWWTITPSIVLTAKSSSLHHMHITLRLSCTCPMCSDTSFYSAYHRPFVERFMHDCYDLEVDASSLVTHICISTSHLHACPHDIFACAQFMCLHAMSQSFVKPYAMLDDNTCLVNHLLNAWFCTNANHICFSKCLLYLLILKESQDGGTLESAHCELEGDEYLVNVHFYTAKPSLSHGDLVFDPRSDLSRGEMMRSIPRPSPWTSHHYRKHGVDLRRELAHAPSKLRWTLSSLSFVRIHICRITGSGETLEARTLGCARRSLLP